MRHAKLDDEWLKKELGELGLRGTSTSRRNILVALEMRGLTRAERDVYDRQVIGTPLVYRFLKQIDRGVMGRLLGSLRVDVLDEAPRWHLNREGGG